MRSRRALPAVKLLTDMAVILSFTFLGPLCTANVQSGASWTKAELIQRARASALLEHMAGRIQANSGQAGQYVGSGIGVGPAETCDDAVTVAAMDVCEWGNLLRNAARALDEEAPAGLNGARGCISNPKPATYIISIAWEGSVLTTPPGASCEVKYSLGESPQRALLTVVRVVQES